MSAWFKLIYIHYLGVLFVADIIGIMEDVVGDNPNFYLKGRKRV